MHYADTRLRNTRMKFDKSKVCYLNCKFLKWNQHAIV
jgi:hypothetical protein